MFGKQRSPGSARKWHVVWMLVAMAGREGVRAAESQAPNGLEALKELSVEELLEIKVTSASKKSEPLSGTGAAVTVITGDDIRHSGARALPDVLRMAPGIQVGRVDSHQWAVSARGFNDTFAQSLLVLMDGRSVYTPLFSGTLWAAQDTVLEDLDRIEVIRGPGGTLWGANAVNGVINIVTKTADETQGWLFDGGGGMQPEGFTSVRYGGRLGESTYFRIYGKYDLWDDLDQVGGAPGHDGWWKGQGGLRLDSRPTETDLITFQGDGFGLRGDGMFSSMVRPQFQVPPPATGYASARPGSWEQDGGNVVGRWTHEFSDDSELATQLYYDRSRFDTPLVSEIRNTYDLDLRYRFLLAERQEIVVGGGMRSSDSRLEDSPELVLTRHSRSDQTGNLFAQDEITLLPDRLKVTVGSKVEHNDYTGFEFEPGGRLTWTPLDRHTFWGSVSRAVRVPTQIEHDSRVNLTVLPASPPVVPLPAIVALQGDPSFRSGNVVAYELGYRVQPAPGLSIDAAMFINHYDDLRASRGYVDFSAAPNYLQGIGVIDNGAWGKTYGWELAVTWQAATWWRLHAQYTFLEADLETRPDPLSQLPTLRSSISSPSHQAGLRSNMVLVRDLELDLWLRYVGELDKAGAKIPGLSIAGSSIPDYATLDVRLAWRARPNLELSVVGQNLLETAHREFNPTFISTQFSEVGRTAYGRVTWHF